MRAKHIAAVLPDGTRVRLAPGRHSSPREGVCVVELASLIAKEEFSDRPACVCPVIAAFLRGWNDRAAHAERQRLGPYAARVVGSRGSQAVTRKRRDICLESAGAQLSRGRVRRLVSLVGMRARIAIYCGLREAIRLNEGAGDYAARLAVTQGSVERAFGLADVLLAVGDAPPGGSTVASPGNGRVHLNRNGVPAMGRNGASAVNGNGSIPTNGAPSPGTGADDESLDDSDVVLAER